MHLVRFFFIRVFYYGWSHFLDLPDGLPDSTRTIGESAVPVTGFDRLFLHLSPSHCLDQMFCLRRYPVSPLHTTSTIPSRSFTILSSSSGLISAQVILFLFLSISSFLATNAVDLVSSLSDSFFEPAMVALFLY